MFRSFFLFLVEVIAVLLGFKPRAGKTFLCVLQGHAPLTVLRTRGAFSGLIGLLNHSSLPMSAALLLPHLKSVHTSGMAFSIDIVFLDKKNFVLKIVNRCPPGKIARGPFKTKNVLEMAEGATVFYGIEVGTKLEFVPT